jgi:hypothetical protein
MTLIPSYLSPESIKTGLFNIFIKIYHIFISYSNNMFRYPILHLFKKIKYFYFNK